MPDRPVQNKSSHQLFKLQSELPQLQAVCYYLHRVSTWQAHIRHKPHMCLLRTRLVRRQRQPLLSVQLELPDLPFQSFQLHDLSSRTVQICGQRLLCDLWNWPHLDHSCKHLRHLRIELLHLCESDWKMSGLQTRHVPWRGSTLLHGTDEWILLEYLHESVRKMRPEVQQMRAQRDKLHRVQLGSAQYFRWKLQSMLRRPVHFQQLLL